jgi:multidrug transporter EmrE-like cation transporter
MILYLFFAVAASLLMAIGLLMMKSRSAHLPIATGANMFGAIAAWIRDPMWFGGLGVQTVGWACYVIAVSRAPVSMVAVMGQGGIALFVIASVLILGERASVREWTGIAAIVFGILMLTLSLGGAEGEGAFEPATLLTFTAVLTLAGLAPMAVARMNASGMAAAILSGVAFGLGGLFTKALTQAFTAGDAASIAFRIISSPYLYATLVADIGGMVLLQNSFHSARAIIAMPLSGAVSNIVPIIGGIIVFGERLPAGPMQAAMRLGAFALTIAAGALLAGSREQVAIDPVVVRAVASGK